MTDRMKEAVFSSLGDCEGLRVLDLFAGSGALGLEGLSRGATQAIFVEKERDAILKLEQNLEATKLGDRAEVLWSDVISTLEHGAAERVDLVFVDPPYNNSPASVLEVMEAIVMHGWLSDEGRVVLHRPARERALEPLGLKVQWSRDYGQSNVSVFCHEEEAD
jgi:16S rRNA (guanine(966)-N(2))-methyltransferase RsmD